MANEEHNYKPDLMQAMLDINSGKKLPFDFDWEQELNHIGKFWQYMPIKTPTILWLWGLISIVDDPEDRVGILRCMQKIYYRYPGTMDDQNELFVSLTALVNANEKIAKFKKNRPIAYVKNPWPEASNPLNGIAHILSDEVVEARYLVSLAQKVRLAEFKKQSNNILRLVLDAYFYSEAFINKTLIIFITYLFKAEGYRQLFLSGKIEFEDLPKDITINRRMRNQCFDIYIKNRIEVIKEKFDKDESLVLDPTELECYRELMLEEKASINIFKSGNKQIYPSRDKVLELADIFIKYLAIQIENIMKKESNKEHEIVKTINLNAPVDQFIANVENLNSTK